MVRLPASTTRALRRLLCECWELGHEGCSGHAGMPENSGVHAGLQSKYYISLIKQLRGSDQHHRRNTYSRDTRCGKSRSNRLPYISRMSGWWHWIASEPTLTYQYFRWESGRMHPELSSVIDDDAENDPWLRLYVSRSVYHVSYWDQYIIGSICTNDNFDVKLKARGSGRKDNTLNLVHDVSQYS